MNDLRGRPWVFLVALNHLQKDILGDVDAAALLHARLAALLLLPELHLAGAIATIEVASDVLAQCGQSF